MKQTEITYITPPYPRQLRLDTAGNNCNAACKSCHRFLSKRKGQMPMAMFYEILGDVSRWPAPLTEIIPVNYGEFFTLPNWDTVLSAIAKALPETQIVLPTNGSLIDEAVADRLCQIPTLKIINFSINAYFDETYEAFMGLPASNMTKILKAIARIKTQRPNITIWASMVHDPMYQSDLERDKFLALWSALANKAWVLSASSANRPEKSPMIQHKIPCRSIFSDLVVGYDGKLSSCCFDAGFSLDLGEYQGDLKAAWRNEKMEQLRGLHNQHRRNEVGLCSKCTSA